MFQWFEKVLEGCKKLVGSNGYLEIGLGLGRYLIRELKSKCFSDYLAVDLIPASVKQSEEYLFYFGMDKTRYRIQQGDFFGFSMEKQFDFIVRGEVLEHVEQPGAMLEKINALLAKTGRALITMVINALVIERRNVCFLMNAKMGIVEILEKGDNRK